ncbi:MAG: hypothetical protein M5U12_03025 [Verrucomicrobia bacterium]|nr:hypothetical protein [Verrucomicrobiota bacterium]
MEAPTRNYHREFLKSPHHGVFGFLTLGLGFMSGAWLPLIAGGTLYALGWIYLPDLGFFRRWADRRAEATRQAEEARKVAAFVQRREALLASLSPSRRERYRLLADVCRDIEAASTDNPFATATTAGDPPPPQAGRAHVDPVAPARHRGILERFLEIERRENLPTLVADGEAEVGRLGLEIESLKAQGPSPTLETKQRFLSSRLERLEVLRKRQQRLEQAQANLALVRSEQERLDQQIKLIRADAVARKNADALSARIDATVEHLDQTNKWLAEMDEFKDLAGDLPPTETRLGYESPVPPRLPQPESGPRARPVAANRQR